MAEFAFRQKGRAMKCVVDGCDNKSGPGRGMCHKHYKRWQQHGHTGLTSGKGCPDVKERLALRGVRVASGCMEWDGPKNRAGYGQTKSDYKFWLVHRLAWTLVNGPIPEGMLVCHKCDNPACFDVDHLFLGTHQDNRLDCIAKGRHNIVSGSRHHFYGKTPGKPFPKGHVPHNAARRQA